jgi:hypothetical protein
MRHVFGVCASLFFLTSTACTEAIVDSFFDGGGLEGPSFGGQTDRTYQIVNYNDALTVTGTCNSLTPVLMYSTDGGTTWQAPSGPDVDCTDGTFTLTYSDCSLAPINFTAVTAQGSRVDIHLRTENSLVVSSTSVFHVQLGAAFNNFLTQVGSGGGTMTGGSLKVSNARFGAPIAKNVISGGGFKVHVVGGE